MPNKLEPLIPESYYHVYNRANGNERLFKSTENYRYFLAKYTEYFAPIADTFCYCLMPNHFHFLIRIKSENDLSIFFDEQLKCDLRGFKNLEGHTSAAKKIEQLISKRFSNFFNAYAKAYNKAHNRLGSLFMHPYKRKQITNTDYLIQLVQYIHRNPLEAKLVSKLEDWPYSSYASIILNENHFIQANDVITWFHDLDNFKYVHTKNKSFSLIEK